MILIDRQIAHKCLSQSMVVPYDPSLLNPASLDILIGETAIIETAHGWKKIDLTTYTKENPFMVGPKEFLLVSSMETFNMPVDICGEFRLKSSRAREGWDQCFLGETLIPVPEGGFKPISEIKPGDSVYSIEDGKARIGKVTASFVSGYVSKTVKVTLDNFTSFECTPEHLIMLRDGTYQKAEDLVPGRALMPFARKMMSTGKGDQREQVLSPNIYAQGTWESPKCKWDFTHRVALLRGNNTIPKNYVVHHIDGNPLNNRLENLQVMSKHEHDSIHCRERSQTDEFRERGKKHAKDVLTPYAKSDQGRINSSESAKGRAQQWNESLWSNPEHRQKMLPIQIDNLNRGRNAIQYRDKTRKAASIGRLKQVIGMLMAQGLEVNASNYLSVKPQRYPRIETYEREFGSFENALKIAGYENHKVVSIEHIERPILVPVYDLTVDYFHNFAIGAGIYVHNCLAVWLDNGWHGSKLTMELVNHLCFSSLPLYPGLKIGQIIFYQTEVPTRHYGQTGRYNGDTTVMASKG